MGRKIDDVIAGLPKSRRDRIEMKADGMAREMIAYADSLGVVRRALSKTQSRIGEDLGLAQNAVSQLERRTDLLLSTLRRYVRALGADLDLVVRLKDGSSIVLGGLGEAAQPSGRKPSAGARAGAKAGHKATR